MASIVSSNQMLTLNKLIEKEAARRRSTDLKSPMSSNSMSCSSSSTSLSLLSSSRSKDTVAPHIRYQTSPLANMSSAEYQQHIQANICEQSLAHSSLSNSSSSSSSTPMDYLEYLEKQPCFPPTYTAANATGTVRYPVYDRVETYELPNYSPSIYHVALVLRKVEWLSPYEPSPIRSWKNLVMELNSTQLNFYAIDNLPLLSRVKKSKTKKYYEFTQIENDYILNALKQKPGEYLTSKRLVKSYSLQFAKFGLPVDYKKKNNCLRVRAETEQFLIHFNSIDEMISWANYLSIGINVSLDIEKRPMPTDRTVPRRRRNRRCSSSNRNRSYSDSELIRRELTPTKRRSSFSGESSIKNKFNRIFNRKKSTADMDQVSKLFQESSIASSSSTLSSNTSVANSAGLINSPPQLSLDSSDGINAEEEEAESIRNEITTIREEEEEDGEEGDANSVHELHDDDSDYEESIHERNSSSDLFNGYQLNFTEKWKPDYKVMTRRKFLKDSLRCIKLLPGDEEWVGKFLVRSTNPPKFETANQIKNKNGKNKFVKEFIVGPQGLVTTC